MIIGTKRMEVKEIEVKRIERVEKTVGVCLEFTPREIAEITAALSVTSSHSRQQSESVNKKHLHGFGLFTKLEKVYEELVEEGAFDNE